MATTAPTRRLTWQAGTVTAVHLETPRTKSLTFALPQWPGHRAGQHVDIRLTAEDGYQAERSYSIASPPEAGTAVTLTVERLDDGEVSPYLTDEVRVGDMLEVRGPIGGYFVWETALGGPLLLVAGGSGIVPLMAMLRHRAAQGSDIPAHVVYSSRTDDDIIYRDELSALAATDPHLTMTHTLTRAQPPGWAGYARRVDEALLREVVWPASAAPLAYICGPTPFVEAAATALAAIGYARDRIKTERFGATGGQR